MTKEEFLSDFYQFLKETDARAHERDQAMDYLSVYLDRVIAVSLTLVKTPWKED